MIRYTDQWLFPRAKICCGIPKIKKLFKTLFVQEKWSNFEPDKIDVHEYTYFDEHSQFFNKLDWTRSKYDKQPWK